MPSGGTTDTRRLILDLIMPDAKLLGIQQLRNFLDNGRVKSHGAKSIARLPDIDNLPNRRFRVAAEIANVRRSRPAEIRFLGSFGNNTVQFLSEFLHLIVIKNTIPEQKAVLVKFLDLVRVQHCSIIIPTN